MKYAFVYKKKQISNSCESSMEKSHMHLHGSRVIPWSLNPPVNGADPSNVVIGHDPGLLGLEIADASWRQAGPPQRAVLEHLHAARLGRRAIPLVIALSNDTSTWIFGPDTAAAVVGPISHGQAERMLQTALDEPNGLAARRRITALFDAIASTAVAGRENFLSGVANSGLFATHELATGVRRRPDWTDACRLAQPLLATRREALIEELGYVAEMHGGHARLLRARGADPRAVAVLLEEGETFDADSSRFAVSPVAYGLAAAQRLGLSWLIIIRGSQIRLYPTRPEIGIGRKGLAETWFELDLALVDEATAGYLPLVFSADALAERGSTRQILAASSQYAVGLGSRLRDKVYVEIVPRMAVAVAHALEGKGHALDREGLDLAYRLTLRIFFRILFQAYAEDRKLLPYGISERYTRNALKTMAQDFVREPDAVFDAESQTMWDDLAQVWRVIDKGDKSWQMPAYNGGLFSSDTLLHPEGALLDGISITNDVIGPVLQALLIDVDQEGIRGPVDFRSLSVREFGTIYEGLLESSLGIAVTDLTLNENETWVPAGAGERIMAPCGSVYFHNTSGQRKGTGSYYTPSFVVEHLLERTLDPALDRHLTKVAALLDAGDTTGAHALFFDFRVADLAMGSGHFLTAAIDHIESRMAAFLAEHDVPGVSEELRNLERAALAAMGPDAPEVEASSLLRRQIARRCIYGLDINPISVELARVSIWIHTFVRGLPMSSLDHNLVCANSLTGIGTLEEAIDVLVPGHETGASLFTGGVREALENARDILVDVANASEATRREAQNAAEAVRRARESARPARLLCDAAVLVRTGFWGNNLPLDPEGFIAKADEPEAQAALASLLCAHMPCLFPEVFLREPGGFDVLIGNPPWEELMVEEPKFWLRVSPGLFGLQPAELKERIAALRVERADLLPELEAEIASAATARRLLLAGPYPGLGTGDVDLYRVFAWRNWQLLRNNGGAGIVFPRSLLNAAGNAQWRDVILDNADIEAVGVINTNGWVFPGIHQQYSIMLVAIAKSSKSESVKLAGPFHDADAFRNGHTQFGSISKVLVRAASAGAAFPQLPDTRSAEIFAVLRQAPRLDTVTNDWDFRPLAEFHATNDRATFDAGGGADGRWPVYGGRSFNLWQPDTGENDYFAWADPNQVIDALMAKRQNQANMTNSAFYGTPASILSDPSTLPCMEPRIAFRDVTNATNTRTMIAALVPGNIVLTNKAPYLLRLNGSEKEEAYLLGVLCSIPLDWYARRYVELGMNFHIFKGLPIPRPDGTSELRKKVIEIAGRLAAKDERFADWAKAVGVPVGSVKNPAVEAELIAELDAAVALLYGLTLEQLKHVYATFHRGWDFADRLKMVCVYYRKLGA